MPNLPACKVCRTPERRRLIDAAYAEGMRPAAIVRREAETGFAITSRTIIKHLREHYVPSPPPGVAKTKKDLAILVQERTIEWLEREDENGERIGPDHHAWKDALVPGLQAQKILDTRAARTDDRKVAFILAQALLGGTSSAMLAPPQLLSGEDDVIDGEATELE